MTICESGIDWRHLNESILDKIFRKLTIMERIKAESVCKRWKKILRSKSFWTSINSKNELLDGQWSSELLSNLITHSALGNPRQPLVNGLNFWARFSPIREIDLTGATVNAWLPLDFLKLLLLCKKLKVLKLSKMKSIINGEMYFYSDEFKKINEICIKAESLQCLEIDVKTKERRSNRNPFLDPWQWEILLRWLTVPGSVVEVIRLEILKVPDSRWMATDINDDLLIRQFYHPYLHLQDLGYALCSSLTVESICIGRQIQLKDVGLVLFFQAMKDNKSISYLNIQKNSITATGALYMADIFKNHGPPIIKLDLRKNHVSSVALDTLEKAMRFNMGDWPVEILH